MINNEQTAIKQISEHEIALVSGGDIGMAAAEGGIRGGATGATLGAYVGSFAGPFGALLGGLIGGGVGTIIGAADSISDYGDTKDT